MKCYIAGMHRVLETTPRGPTLTGEWWKLWLADSSDSAPARPIPPLAKEMVLAAMAAGADAVTKLAVIYGQEPVLIMGLRASGYPIPEGARLVSIR